MTTQKVSVTLEADVIERARRTAGPRGLSSYLDTALAEKLERDEKRTALLAFLDELGAGGHRAHARRDETPSSTASRADSRAGHRVSDPAVVLDSGVVDLSVTDQEFRWVLRDLVEGGWVPMIPTVVLAEAISGRPTDAPVNRVVKQIGPVDTTPPTARLAGRLRHVVKRSGARRIPGGIDAIVAAHAAEVGVGVVFTTDPTDLQRLLADTPRVLVKKP
jgi:predicted nucleic acid-binding protein